MNQSRWIVSVVIAFVGFTVAASPASAQFAIRPDYIGANVQIPYNGPETAESQFLRMRSQNMRYELEYQQAMAQMQALAQHEQMQQQMYWAAQQQAQYQAQLQAQWEAQRQAEQWRAAQSRPSRAPQPSVPRNVMRLASNSTGSPVVSTRPKQLRITLQPVRDRSGNLVLRVISVVEEDADE